jgi:threonylcarbamoyladenosine tRNA methylthiotransferase MtaB
VNRADLDALAAELAGACEVARRGEPADVVVVNTCSVTGDAEATARQAIRRAAREFPGAPIVAAGCHAELAPEELARLPGVAAVVGARSAATALAEAVRRVVAPPSPWPSPPAGPGGEGSSGSPPEDLWGAAPSTPALHTRPILKVQDGCDRRCSYCVVPLARGRSRSMPVDEALRRIALLSARHAEVVLAGVHLGAYGRDLAPRGSLSELVTGAVRGGARRLRLSSVEPDELPLDLLASREVRAALCPHLHLPLQSGSARVLAAMRRPYRPGRFREVVEEIAARIPGACVGTDVIVGFPGETDADHRETVALVESLPLAYLHVFPFSPRRGTPAAEMGDRVPAAVVEERAAALRALSERRWRAFLADQVGRELEVVVERVEAGVARGTAREWLTVRWPGGGEARGALARVRVTSSDGEQCLGAAPSPQRGA